MALYMPLVSFDQTNFNGVWSISKLFGAVSPISLRAKPETRTDAIFLTFGVPSSLDHEQHRVLPLLTKTLDGKMDALKKKINLDRARMSLLMVRSMIKLS